SVFIGIMVGASSVLALDQLKNLFGWETQGSPGDHHLKRFWLSLTMGGGVHWPTLLMGAGTIAVVVAIRRFNGFCRDRGARFPIPQHLVATAVMATLVWAFRLDDRYGVQIVGAIPVALPSFQLPDLRWDQVRPLAGN